MLSAPEPRFAISGVETTHPRGRRRVRELCPRSYGSRARPARRAAFSVGDRRRRNGPGQRSARARLRNHGSPLRRELHQRQRKAASRGSTRGGSLLEEARLHGEPPAHDRPAARNRRRLGLRRACADRALYAGARGRRPDRACPGACGARQPAACRSPRPRSSSRAVAAPALQRASGSSRSSPACSAVPSAARAQ